MPKNTSSGAPKKARWSAAKKADAQRGPKKPHRGQSRDGAKTSYAGKAPRADRSPRWSDRDDRGRPVPRIHPDVDLASYMEGWRDVLQEIWKAVKARLKS